jgi:hypothetical protein
MITAVRLAASSGRALLDPAEKRGGFIPRSRAIKQRARSARDRAQIVCSDKAASGSASRPRVSALSTGSAT